MSQTRHKLPAHPLDVNKGDLDYASKMLIKNIGNYVVLSTAVKVGVGVGGKLITSLNKGNKI